MSSYHPRWCSSLRLEESKKGWPKDLDKGRGRQVTRRSCKVRNKQIFFSSCLCSWFLSFICGRHGEGNWKALLSSIDLDRNASQVSQRWASMKKKGMFLLLERMSLLLPKGLIPASILVSLPSTVASSTTSSPAKPQMPSSPAATALWPSAKPPTQPWMEKC